MLCLLALLHCVLLFFQARAEFIPLSFGVGRCSLGDYPPATNHASCNVAAYRYTIDLVQGPFAILRFSSFFLPDDDFVIVRSLDANSSKKLRLSGRNHRGAFDTPPIVANSIAIELYTRAPNASSHSCYGFQVSGYTSNLMEEAHQESLCGGVDRTLEAPCYKYNTLMFARSDAVARLLINKNGAYTACTGWLLGSEGHLITYRDCISAQEHTHRMQVDFNAQAPTCPSKAGDIVCTKPMACGKASDTYIGSPRLVVSSATFNYTIIQLDKTLADKYRYLKLRVAGPVLSESIYIVQHPLGYGKRISDKTATGKATIEATNGKDAAYRLDTQGMSSGSPVLSSTDHTVVAMHYGGLAACPNFGIRSDVIVSDLQARKINIPNAFVYTVADA
ncbi:hypothetical protein AC1031_004392 [Aphanomyces cochlioides]|nr:hypothetical protein AC1031_004392 [Aphanomyces cochlioides]